MTQKVHFVPVEAASREDEPRDETQIVWLELEVPAASPWCERDLVCAGRAGFNLSLTPVAVDSIGAKLEAFVREYGRGSLLIAGRNCEASRPFHHNFDALWLVESLPELASKIAEVPEVRERLTRSGPLNVTQINSVIGQLDYLIEYARDNLSAIHLCDRVKANGFTEDVLQFQRLKIKRRHADSLRHAGRFKESLNVVAEMKAILDSCGEVLSFDDQAGHAVANASALFDACDFEAAAEWLRGPLEICGNAPRSISAQNRVELYNTMARIMVMTCQCGWDELFRESARLQRFFDPASVRRTESYLVHGLLRNRRLDEAESVIQRHEADDRTDTFSKRFTVFYRCELNRLRRQLSTPPDAGVTCYTTAFALQACGRQSGREPAEQMKLLEKAEAILLQMTAGKEEGHLLSLIAAAVSLACAVTQNDGDRWTTAIARLSKSAETFGEPARQYLRPTLESLASTPSVADCERLLQLMPYL